MSRNYVWCVDTGSTLLSGMIHSTLFLDEAEARTFAEKFTGQHWYCKVYRCEDIWHFTERAMRRC